MWMYRQNGIEFYKHVDTRSYLLLDSQLRCWRQGKHGFEPSDFAREFDLVTATGTTTGELAGDIQGVGRWAGDISGARIGNLWRPEDHEAVMHNLRAADRLATEVVAYASGKRLKGFRRSLKEG